MTSHLRKQNNVHIAISSFDRERYRLMRTEHNQIDRCFSDSQIPYAKMLDGSRQHGMREADAALGGIDCQAKR
jgi:hypothetical protein